MNEQYRETYRVEAEELLAELETALLELEERPDDGDLVARAFRAMHTLKGSGAMFGFEDIAAFTHELETVFDRVRGGTLQVTQELVEIALQSRDHVRALLEGAADPAVGNALVARLHALAAAPAVGPAVRSADAATGGAGDGGPTTARSAAPLASDGAGLVTYRIHLSLPPDVFATGTNPLLLLGELEELGRCRVVAHTKGVPAIEEIDPEACHLSWDIILNTDRGENAIQDVFLFLPEGAALSVTPIDAGRLDGGEDDRPLKRLGEILVERGDLQPSDLERFVRSRPRIGEELARAGLVSTTEVEAALAEQEAVRERRAAVRARSGGEETAGSASIRVTAGKLDTLVDLVGELVIAQARLSQVASGYEDPQLATIAEEVERLTSELRDATLNIRMLPIGSTFTRFRRLVRDLSSELGRDVQLVTEGAETELDKTVIERLNDPLVHLIRNSIDHGIEPPDVRAAAGKPRSGTVRLTAAHSGADVVIRIEDDGAGIDRQRLRRKAEERGLIAPDVALSDAELLDLVFAAGFSTAEKVSAVSGRGVGMDVVRRSVEALRGSVRIESERGKGTVVTVRLPLTLAIIEGLLVRVGQDGFVLPLTAVEECVQLTRADLARSHGHRLARVRDQLVPYVRLREWFDVAGESPEIEQIAVMNVDGARFGFVVDHVIGQHQTVIKALGKVYRNVRGLSGATILGDGTVALILDVPHLIGEALSGVGAVQ